MRKEGRIMSIMRPIWKCSANITSVEEWQEIFDNVDEEVEEIQIHKINFKLADTFNAETQKICRKIYKSYAKLIVNDRFKKNKMDKIAEWLKTIEQRARIGHSHNQSDDKEEK
ncbi:MAG: hypothetical protein CL661_12145 [Bacteroidetes bacterium]|nr:hypothetical protein [Bacteroidota bacterium]